MCSQIPKEIRGKFIFELYAAFKPVKFLHLTVTGDITMSQQPYGPNTELFSDFI